MTSSLVVLRNSILLMFLLALITGFYVRHVTRLSADAAAQSAVTAAVQAATAVGWSCEPTPPPEAVTAAARATVGQIGHLGLQPVAVELRADACNLIAAVTAAPLNARWSGLNTTAVACRSATQSSVLDVPGSC